MDTQQCHQMGNPRRDRTWLWATLMLSSISIAGAVFAFWELIENRFFRDLDYASLHYLYISRGIACSLLLAIWAAWFVIRQRRSSDEQLRRSHERYRGLLDASPSAVALFDARFVVDEWNSAAERLYGFPREDVIGQKLPNVPNERRNELLGFLDRVAAGDRVVDIETERHDRHGKVIDVQESLLPYHENGKVFFLEVSTDIGERVELRKRAVELEKLTAIGNMAAGTAHHLNTPLASMLLRVQMMKDRSHNSGCRHDLEHLEKSIDFCQQFVRQLLEFSRQVKSQKQPEKLGTIVNAVIGFLSPSFSAKQTDVVIDLTEGLAGLQVLADRNQLETVLLTLFSNSLDAIAPGGHIALRVTQPSLSTVQLTIEDNGSGISPTIAEHLFEPFFTTKPSGKGTGLGLALAKNIIIEHGGAVELRPRIEGGAIASVSLPVYHPSDVAEVRA
jgi:two-component system, sporulation sensor kinase A